MILNLLVMNLNVKVEERRKVSPFVFECIEEKVFIDLQIEIWDGKLDSLPTDRFVLIDVEDYFGNWNPDVDWKYAQLWAVCKEYGHVPFRRNGIALPTGYVDRISVHEELEFLINRIRSSGQS